MSLLEDHHVYSYSQLTSFDMCPYGFYLQRIEKAPQKSNGFAEQGTLIHSLIDEWAKGELKKADMPKEYEKRYSLEVVTHFPKMLASKGYTEKTYLQGLEYLENFDEFDGYEIIETEKKYTTTIADRPFVGVIDMIMHDKQTGELIICDHKSKSLSAFKKAEKEMYRQQLIYAKFVYESLGIWPDRMMFNLFKENGLKMEKPFSPKEYQDTLSWAEDIINKVESYEFIDWLQVKDQDFFCTEICSVRDHCDNGNWKTGAKSKKH